MGMQCHFNIKDLPNFSKQVTYDYEINSYSYEINSSWAVECSLNGDAWFDVGSCSVGQLSRIEHLIKNRVPFQCS